MGAAAREIDAVHVLEPVARPQVEHLPEVVREVEGRAEVDAHAFPIPGGQHPLRPDMGPHVPAHEACQPIQDELAVELIELGHP